MSDRFFSNTRPQNGSIQLRTAPIKRPLQPGVTYNLQIDEIMQQDSVMMITEDCFVLVGLGEGARFLENSIMGEKITLSINIEPFPGKIMYAVGGTPRLLRNGEISIEAEAEKVSQSFVDTRHPRTAVGYNDNFIFFVTVDGRQPGYSIGMDLNELAGFLKKLSATEAINLDGGGSTTMWAGGKIRNRPSDGRVRPIANALIVYSKIHVKK